jgi:hypothetical protein
MVNLLKAVAFTEELHEILRNNISQIRGLWLQKPIALSKKDVSLTA